MIGISAVVGRETEQRRLLGSLEQLELAGGNGRTEVGLLGWGRAAQCTPYRLLMSVIHIWWALAICCVKQYSNSQTKWYFQMEGWLQQGGVIFLTWFAKHQSNSSIGEKGKWSFVETFLKQKCLWLNRLWVDVSLRTVQTWKLSYLYGSSAWDLLLFSLFDVFVQTIWCRNSTYL